jgi:hypothetical protein
VTFTQKWSVIMALPIGIYVINLSIQSVLILYRICIMRAPRRVACADAGSLALAAVLSLAYIMYIYLAKNVLVRGAGECGVLRNERRSAAPHPLPPPAYECRTC